MSTEILQVIYQDDVDHLDEILSPPKWIRISQTEKQQLILIMIPYPIETVWQFTMSFNYILLKMYDNPGFNNIMKLSINEECYQILFQEFTTSYPNPIASQTDDNTSTFLFEMTPNSNAIFTERVDEE